jgi:hypothetical protein
LVFWVDFSNKNTKKREILISLFFHVLFFPFLFLLFF